jgi:S1-C subfamily serine protease
MRRVLYSMVCVVCFQAPMFSQSPDWSTVIQPSLKQVVRLEILREEATEPGVCSSVVINKDGGYLLTAAHCVAKKLAAGVSVTAGGRHAEIVKVNELLDLAVLKTRLRYETTMVLAEQTPAAGTPIAVVGFAFGDPDVVFQFGYVAQTKNSLTKLVFLNADVIEGNSGGACIDAQGRLVAINSKLYSWNSAGLGGSAPVEQIREFAEDYLPKAGK